VGRAKVPRYLTVKEAYLMQVAPRHYSSASLLL